MTRLAIAGLQHQHVRYLLTALETPTQRLELVGVSEADDSLVGEYGLAEIPRYVDHQSMLEEAKPDVLGVFARNSDRGQVVIDALARGIRVIADKPLCTKLGELDRIEELAVANATVVAVIFEKRNRGITKALAQLILAGELGDLALVTSFGPHRLQPAKRPSWMFDHAQYGGILNDLAIHDIDLVCRFTEARHGRVMGIAGAETEVGRRLKFPDHGVVVVEPHGGPIAALTVDWLAQPAQEPDEYRMSVVGSRGSAEVLWGSGRLHFRRADGSSRQIEIPRDMGPASDALESIDAPSSWARTSLETVRATRIALLAEQSALEGGAWLQWENRAPFQPRARR